MKKRQWKESDEEFDVIWTEKEWISDILDHCHLTNGQKLNHFRNYYEVPKNNKPIYKNINSNNNNKYLYIIFIVM